MPVPTPFAALIAAVAGADGDDAITVPDDWLQGRTVYGGLALALGLEAAALAIDDGAVLRSAQVAFIGPASGRISISVAPLRRGRNVTFLGVDLHGAGGIASHMTLCYGAARPSALQENRLIMPEAPAPEDCPPFLGGIAPPAFIRHFELRRAGGEAPASAAATGEMLVWARHRDQAAWSGLSALMALADVLPPAIVTRLDSMAPVSSMTWQVNPLAPAPQTRNGWWLMQSVNEAAGDGYASQNMLTWSANGEAVLAGRQSVAVFA